MSAAPKSQSFDQAADYYDETRHLPEPLATGGIQMILDHLQGRAGHSAQLLEVGTGTGRIAIPLLERGANLFGCDLSAKMLARQRAKWTEARLSQADATALPFADAQFDGVLTIHVLHLVGDWRAALREIWRVLRPGGAYVNSWDPHSRADVDTRLRDYWRSRVEAHGARWRRPGVQSRDELLREVARLGARVEAVTAARLVDAITPQAVIESIARRIYSDTWDVPDEVFRVTLDELRGWAAQNYADLERPEMVERRFSLDVIHFK
jgi:ubiquinone/menaquinone biosynthesis C-methylase UbiE